MRDPTTIEGIALTIDHGYPLLRPDDQAPVLGLARQIHEHHVAPLLSADHGERATVSAMPTPDYIAGWEGAVAACRAVLSATGHTSAATELEHVRPPEAQEAGPREPPEPDYPDSAFTWDLKDAAAQAGVHVSTLRQQVSSGGLRGRKVGRAWMVRPEDVKAWVPDNRGRSRGATRVPRLHGRHGEDDGLELRVRAEGETTEVEAGPDPGLALYVDDWSEVEVLTLRQDSGSARYFRLVPGETTERIGNGPFFVEGRFRVVKKVNNAGEAMRRWG